MVPEQVAQRSYKVQRNATVVRSTYSPHMVERNSNYNNVGVSIGDHAKISDTARMSPYPALKRKVER